MRDDGKDGKDGKERARAAVILSEAKNPYSTNGEILRCAQGDIRSSDGTLLPALAALPVIPAPHFSIPAGTPSGNFF